MKKLRLVLILASLFGLHACSTKFNIGAPYKEVTVVYGLLSLSDTAHYIKITKGYFDEKQNNLLLAQNPDSIYFDQLDVVMYVMNNGNPVETIPLQRVDLTLEGYPKEGGIFAKVPNYAYKFKKNLDPNKTYRLHIVNPKSGKVVEGETPVITNAPSEFKFIKPTDFTEELNFADQQNPFGFIWRGPNSAAFYDVVIRFRYQEVNVNTNDTIYVEKDIPVVKNVLSTGGDEISTSLSSVDFFKQLNSAIGDGTVDIKRYVDTPGLIIQAGGQVLKTYMDVSSAQGGITFDQIQPNYTNLSGDNVFGILSTRGQIMFNTIKFNPATIDSIMNGTYTKNLRILGISTK